MRVSVVIPGRNVAPTIGQRLQSLAMQDWRYPWEVVVDNGSADATRAVRWSDGLTTAEREGA